MAQIEKNFLADLDGAEAGYLASMGIRIEEVGEGSEAGHENSLYEMVFELNQGLKVSVAAALAIFRKVCLKLVQGPREPDKRSPRKASQVTLPRLTRHSFPQEPGDDEARDPKVTQWLQIALWLEREYHAQL
jgi:hypothetical protein